MTTTPYDEFGYFSDNASEHGIAYEAPPVVRREMVNLPDGREMSALVWGTEPPELMLIHGGAQNAHTWDTVALALGRPLVAVDMPGHGHSGPPESGATNVERNAQDIAHVFRALAPQADLVVGMSLGGLVSISMAEQDPGLFGTLMLVDMTPGVTRDKAKAIHNFVNGPESFESFDDLLARTMEFNPTRTESSLRRGILHNALQREDGTWVWRHARHRVFEHPTPDSADYDERYRSLWDALEHHDGPICLARGMREQSVVDDSDETELLRRRPDARVEHFADAGHSIQGDMPIELAAFISAVLDGGA